MLSVFYLILLLSYLKGWLKTAEEFVHHKLVDTLAVTVLVPARNEARFIEKCLKSLTEQNYNHNLVEIIVLDDFSDDETFSIASSFNSVKSFQMDKVLDASFQNKPNKKRALDFGISKAQNELIITVDADCVYPKHWLKAMTQFYSKKKPKLLSAPVAFYSEKGVFQDFLAMDLYSLMGITAASIKNGKPSMVNGANLMFSKNTFRAINGYKGNEKVASGDDVFLMQKINKIFPGEIVFLKNTEAIAETLAPQSFKEFVNQRIRWTSKSSRHADKNVVLTLTLNYLYYVSLIIGIALSFSNPILAQIVILSFGLKLVVDAIFFNNLLIFFKRKDLLKSLVGIEILHLLYINILGILSLIGKYSWKGRKV